MDSKKQIKDQNNILIKTSLNDAENQSENSPENLEALAASFRGFESQFNFPARIDDFSKETAGHRSLENIKEIFEKTQVIRNVASAKNQEIQSQFKELKARLNQSSECLHRIQKGINNIKFSYQTKIFEMQKSLEPGDCFDPTKNPLKTKEDMAKHMDEIRDKIENIQNQVYGETEKHGKVMKNYKDAFENVSIVLENIEKGTYSSFNFGDVNKYV